MGSFKVNRDALAILRNLPAEWTKLYITLRDVMDYKTGIAGITYRINDKFFKERMGHSKKQGRKVYCPHIKEIQRWLSGLEEEGLIKIQPNYVYFFPLEERDNSENLDSDKQAQKKWTEVDGKRTGSGRKSKAVKSLNEKEESGVIDRSGQEVDRRFLEVVLTSGDPDILTSNIATVSSLPHTTKSQPLLSSKFRKSEIPTLAVEILNYLRMKTGKKFGKDENHLTEISARLRDKESPTVEDCKLVIDFMWSRWGEDDEMRDHANPTTLFRKRNFYRYFDAAKEGDSNSSDARYEQFVAMRAAQKAEE